MVGGNGGQGGFEAIGQGAGRAEPLPGAAYRQGKLQWRRFNIRMVEHELDSGRPATHSSECGATPAPVNLVRKLPGVTIKQCGK